MVNSKGSRSDFVINVVGYIPNVTKMWIFKFN